MSPLINNATQGLQTLGWDLGGAHVKAVLLDGDGVAAQAIQVACPLWRGLKHLEHALDDILQTLTRPATRHAVTMTGELVDIFKNREDGVQQISDAVAARIGSAQLCFYAGAYGFVSQQQVPAHFSDIASANWHAGAAFLAHGVDQALLMDVGSTTSDLVPLYQGKPANLAFSDAERMRHDELIYTGVVRTPVMAVAQRVPFAGAWPRVAAEHFATMADVYRLTGDLPEACDMADTADGAGRSAEDSARRLARMVGCDLDDAGHDEWRKLALAIKAQQLHILQEGVQRILSRGLLSPDAPLLGAGAGRFLVKELARNMGLEFRDVATMIAADPAVGDWAVTCLPAYAVGRLAMNDSPWR